MKTICLVLKEKLDCDKCDTILLRLFQTALTVNETGFVVGNIGSVKKISDCKWNYTFTYDEAQVTRELVEDDIQRVCCGGCIFDYFASLPAGNVCVESSDTIDFSITEDGCITGDVIGGGSGWGLLGNAGTVDGVNFLGTTDNVPFTIRTNNDPSFRINPANGTPDNSSPDIIGGWNENSIIGTGTIGGGNAILSGGYSGQANTIDSTDGLIISFSLIGGGLLNSILDTADWCGIFSGLQNTISGFENEACVILGGENNTITGTTNGNFADFIIAGDSNTITRATGGQKESGILGGAGNTITDGDACWIGVGNNNTITGTTATSGIFGGDTNVIDGANGNIIGAGYGNTITEGLNCGILCGSGNQILYGRHEVVFGQQNTLDFSAAFVSGGNIVAGTANTISSVLGGIDVHGIACFGHNNTVTSAFDSAIHGYTNSISNTHYAVIGGGAGNAIIGPGDATGDSSVICGGGFTGGLGNTITNSLSAIIGAGRSNSIDTSDFSAILGGFGNIIDTADYSSILGGAYLKLGANSVGFQQHFDDEEPTPPLRDMSGFTGLWYAGDLDIFVANTRGAGEQGRVFWGTPGADVATSTYVSWETDDEYDTQRLIWPTGAPSVGDVLTCDSISGGKYFTEWSAGGGGGFITAISDTSTIDLSVVGTTLSGAAKVSADGGNIISAHADGLYAAASGSGISIGDAIGSGTVGSLLFVGTGPALAQDNSSIFFDNANNRLGLLTTTPKSSLDTANSFGAGIVTKTSTYTAAETDYTILCDCTSGAITINLPAASGIPRRIYNIKKIDSSGNAVTIDGSGSETIDGATTKTISTQYQSYTIQCDGSAWYIL